MGLPLVKIVAAALIFALVAVAAGHALADTPITAGGAAWRFRSPTDGAEIIVRTTASIELADPVTTPYDDRTFTYFGTWQEYIAPEPDTTKFRAGDHYTDTVGASSGFIFIGTRVTFFGSRSPWLGIASFSVDGATVDVDLYAPANGDQQIVFDSGQLAMGTHRILVRNTGRRNAASSGSCSGLTAPCVSVDRADVVGALIAPLAP